MINLERLKGFISTPKKVTFLYKRKKGHGCKTILQEISDKVLMSDVSVKIDH